jgi:hypothetical protein
MLGADAANPRSPNLITSSAGAKPRWRDRVMCISRPVQLLYYEKSSRFEDAIIARSLCIAAKAQFKTTWEEWKAWANLEERD